MTRATWVTHERPTHYRMVTVADAGTNAKGYSGARRRHERDGQFTQEGRTIHNRVDRALSVNGKSVILDANTTVDARKPLNPSGFFFSRTTREQIGDRMTEAATLTPEQIDVRALEYERILRKRAFVYLNLIVERREKSPRSITFATLHLPPRSGMSPRQLWVIDADNARLHLSQSGHENFTHPLAAEALRLLHQEHRSTADVARLLGVGSRTLTHIVDEGLIMFALAIADMPLSITDYYEQSQHRTGAPSDRARTEHLNQWP